MEKQQDRKHDRKTTKSFQDVSKEVKDEPDLKNSQPTPQPEDFEEIEY
jgi:hypothetical protein